MTGNIKLTVGGITYTVKEVGAAEEDGKLLTSGGRVLGVTAVRPELAEAIDAAYDMLDRIDFANKYYRADIGQRALKAVK